MMAEGKVPPNEPAAYVLEEFGNGFLTIFGLRPHSFDSVCSETTTRDVDRHGIFPEKSSECLILCCSFRKFHPAWDSHREVKSLLAESKTPLTPPAPPATPPAIDLDTAQLDQIIGVKGQANGGVYQFAVPRRDPVTENGMQLTPPGPTGVATAIGFQPTGGGKAAITGDFVLTGKR